MNVAQLAAYIAKHSINAHVGCDGKIVVEAVYCKDGVAFSEIETIDPTFQAVRDWLGY
ncbi:MAG TPA: hypothetical protein VJ846_05145 [Sphingomicrobium sp.]|nr:hypothetical protein [Sphingomicrobium sp.]